MKISQRYQKVLVTVAMGLRSKEDIEKNGLYRFTKQEAKQLIKYVTSLFHVNKSVLALKVKQIGYSTEHIHMNSEKDLKKFIKHLDTIFEEDNEIWVVSSSVIECWRCRIYLSKNGSNDIIEMAYSYDDHILDHIDSNSKTPYVYFKKEEESFKAHNTNLDNERLQEVNSIVEDILYKYANRFRTIKEDLDFIGIDGISLDVRVNHEYDFHDFDVPYDDIEKVIEYYVT